MTAFAAKTASPLSIQIAEHLEQRITSGELRDGERLPTTTELAKSYGVSPVTIQKGLQRLTEMDLLERIPKRGTFVKATRTAHMTGLVFGHNPFQEQSAFYLQVLESFRRQAAEMQMNLRIYYDLQDAGSSHDVLFDLRRDVMDRRLKAIIPICRSPELSQWLEAQRDVTWIEPPKFNFHDTVFKGTRYLLNRGYKHIAVISMMPRELLYEDGKAAFAAEQRGCQDAQRGYEAMVVCLRWGQSEVDGYREAKAMFSKPTRPDAIFVHHDVVCRGVLLALMELGYKIPSDVGLLTHANLGCEFATPVPLTRLVVDPAECVRQSLVAAKGAFKTTTPGERISAGRVAVTLVPGQSCGE